MRKVPFIAFATPDSDFNILIPDAYARNLENAIIKSVLVHDVQIQKIRLREFISGQSSNRVRHGRLVAECVQPLRLAAPISQ